MVVLLLNLVNICNVVIFTCTVWIYAPVVLLLQFPFTPIDRLNETSLKEVQFYSGFACLILMKYTMTAMFMLTKLNSLFPTLHACNSFTPTKTSQDTNL